MKKQEYLDNLEKQVPRGLGKSYFHDSQITINKAPDFSKGTCQQKRKAKRVEAKKNKS